MNKNNSIKLEGLSYVTPSVNVLDVQPEGVLCGSFDKDNYTESFDKGAWDEL